MSDGHNTLCTMVFPDANKCRWIYKDANEKYFGGKLPHNLVIIVTNNHDKHNLGIYTHYADKHVGYISINFRMRSSFDAIYSTMLHEMIHAYIHLMDIKDNGDHGSFFQKMALEISHFSGIEVDPTGNHGMI